VRYWQLNCFCGDEDRNELCVVASFVEVLEVKSVIGCLRLICGEKLCGPYLELDYKDYIADNDHRISPFSHSWN